MAEGPEGRSRDGTRARTPFSNPSSLSGSTVGLSLPAPAASPAPELHRVAALVRTWIRARPKRRQQKSRHLLPFSVDM